MKNMFTKIVLTLTLIIISSPIAYADSVNPNDIEIVNVHLSNNLYYIEVENNSDKNIDLSGFEVISNTSMFLYPENGVESFIVPENYKMIFANNISKLEPTLDSSVKTVLVEIPNLKLNKYGGDLKIKDQLGALIDAYSYDSFVDIDTIPDPIFITSSSNKNNISYDYFDSVFLNVEPTEPTTIETKTKEIISTTTKHTQEIIDSTPPSPSINGATISIALALSFIIFFLFKYFSHNKRHFI